MKILELYQSLTVMGLFNNEFYHQVCGIVARFCCIEQISVSWHLAGAFNWFSPYVTFGLRCNDFEYKIDILLLILLITRRYNLTWHLIIINLNRKIILQFFNNYCKYETFYENHSSLLRSLNSFSLSLDLILFFNVFYDF